MFTNIREFLPTGNGELPGVYLIEVDHLTYHEFLYGTPFVNNHRVASADCSCSGNNEGGFVCGQSVFLQQSQ